MVKSSGSTIKQFKYFDGGVLGMAEKVQELEFSR